MPPASIFPASQSGTRAFRYQTGFLIAVPTGSGISIYPHSGTELTGCPSGIPSFKNIGMIRDKAREEQRIGRQVVVGSSEMFGWSPEVLAGHELRMACCT
jgi:hypothetical protein